MSKTSKIQSAKAITFRKSIPMRPNCYFYELLHSKVCMHDRGDHYGSGNPAVVQCEAQIQLGFDGQ